MPTSRIAALSDGVIAVIITIMVLGLKMPKDTTFSALLSVLPAILVYLFSFQTIGTFWNNHHNLLYATKSINTRIMWANLHFLFWLSLIPFATAWLGVYYGESIPTAFYGSILLLTSIAYYLLQQAIISSHPRNKNLKIRLNNDLKSIISLCSYALAIGIVFINPFFSDAIYIAVAAAWFVPDHRLVLNI